jgi:hypothetical protein
MQTIAMKLCSKKKNSQRTNDFKAKSVIDFYSSPISQETPQLMLFGKVVGLPFPRKNELIRSGKIINFMHSVAIPVSL